MHPCIDSTVKAPFLQQFLVEEQGSNHSENGQSARPRQLTSERGIKNPHGGNSSAVFGRRPGCPVNIPGRRLPF